MSHNISCFQWVNGTPPLDAFLEGGNVLVEAQLLTLGEVFPWGRFFKKCEESNGTEEIL